MENQFLRTAECVTPMHPDKICDRISDAILDACLAQDPDSRVAIETMGGHNLITITGELTTTAQIDVQSVARRVVGEQYGIQANIVRQSPEIARGVDGGGAGDQGIMVGYACAGNEALLPQEFYLAKSLAKYIYQYYPVDGKTQVTMQDQQIVTIVASFCGVSSAELIKLVNIWLVDKGYPTTGRILANPAGDWQQGGLTADTGVTGRKIVCDNYGPQIPVGGGAFSGKDATKVDRSGAYMARKIAVDILKAQVAQAVMVKLAYSIGVADPVMAMAEVTMADGDRQFQEISGYNLTPAGIVQLLDLKQPQFEQVAEWGSFGNNFIWDR